MADTVKTQVMMAIKTALQTVTEFKAVHRIPVITPTDLDIINGPTCFFWDEGETRTKRNRLMMGRMEVLVVVHIPIVVEGYESVNDLADTIQGKVHAVMTTNVGIGSALIQMIEEGDVTKDIPNDENLQLVMQYFITYGHNMGDAFNNTGG